MTTMSTMVCLALLVRRGQIRVETSNLVHEMASAIFSGMKLIWQCWLHAGGLRGTLSNTSVLANISPCAKDADSISVMVMFRTIGAMVLKHCDQKVGTLGCARPLQPQKLQEDPGNKAFKEFLQLHWRPIAAWALLSVFAPTINNIAMLIGVVIVMLHPAEDSVQGSGFNGEVCPRGQSVHNEVLQRKPEGKGPRVADNSTKHQTRAVWLNMNWYVCATLLVLMVFLSRRMQSIVPPHGPYMAPTHSVQQNKELTTLDLSLKVEDRMAEFQQTAKELRAAQALIAEAQDSRVMAEKRAAKAEQTAQLAEKRAAKAEQSAQSVASSLLAEFRDTAQQLRTDQESDSRLMADSRAANADQSAQFASSLITEIRETANQLRAAQILMSEANDNRLMDNSRAANAEQGAQSVASSLLAEFRETTNQLRVDFQAISREQIAQSMAINQVAKGRGAAETIPAGLLLTSENLKIWQADKNSKGPAVMFRETSENQLAAKFLSRAQNTSLMSDICTVNEEPSMRSVAINRTGDIKCTEDWLWAARACVVETENNSSVAKS